METAQIAQSKSAKALFANGKAFVYSFTISHDIIVFHAAAIIVTMYFAAALTDINGSVVCSVHICGFAGLRLFYVIFGTSAKREYHTQSKQQTNKTALYHQDHRLQELLLWHNGNSGFSGQPGTVG